MPRNNYPQRKKWRFPTLQHSLLIATIFFGLITLYYWLYRSVELQVTSLPQIVSAITDGKIKALSVQDNLLIAEMHDGTRLSARKESSISTVETLQLFGLPAEAVTDLPIVVEEPRAETNPRGLLLTLTVATFFSYVVLRFSPQLQGRSSGYFFNNMGRSNPRVLSGHTRKGNKINYPPITFQDVAGVEQAKLELQEVIEFLKEPAKFAKLGARVPKGVLMAGPPGTGKTLLAKAVAGEAGVPFFSISGSEFVEMFVGVGAARVRDLFKRAREQAPAVVFVDEIDAVGRQRGASLGNSNDEREHTLNQILVEMDGFGTDTNVIVMASTNRPDVLDPALLRPGRFDRKVILDRPDVQGREAILGVHTRGKPLAPNISISALAKLTPGFAGADLENLVNEAAILAARRNLLMIGQQEFQDAIERIVAGPERQGKILSEHERQVVAFHEAGHAVVMYNLKYSDPVHKVSIVSRGMALGYTMPLPEGDKYLRTREAFEDEIVSLLGGRAAEEIIFQQVTTGASNDLERATKLARAMVTRYGFSKTLGLRTFGEEQGNPYLGSMGEIRDYSEEMAQVIDQEMRQILEGAYQRATDILTAQRQKLEALAELLLECETVERPEFEALMA
jgi:cell division protease FtsH